MLLYFLHDRQVMMRNSTAALGCICLLAGVFFVGAADDVAHGQDAEKSTDSLADKYDSVADQFSAGRFSTRQQATRRVWSMRSRYRDQVKKATEHSDPEVASRARWILDQWRRGIGPDTPPNERRFLQGDLPQTIQELIEDGRFQTAIGALEESADMLEFDMIKEHLSRVISLRFPFYVKTAVETESLAELLQLIDMVAMSSEMAVCRVRMMQKLGVDVDDDSLLPVSAKHWPPGEREIASIAVLSVLGRPEEAIELAKKSVHADLARTTQMMNGRWQEILQTSQLAAIDAEPNSAAQASHWADVVFAADRSGDQATKRDAIDKLLEMELPINSEDLTYRESESLINRGPFAKRWKTLAINGHLEEATDLLKDFPEAYVRMLLVASRPELALDKLGFPIDQIDSQLQDWIGDAVESQKQVAAANVLNPKSTHFVSGGDSPCFEIRQLLALSRVLSATGRTLESRRIVDELCSTKIQYSYDERTLRDYVILYISRTPMRGWIRELAVFPGENSCSHVASWCVANEMLSNMDQATFNVMMSAMQAIKKTDPFDDRFRMVCDLLSGKIPDGFDPKQDFRRLYDQLVGAGTAYTRTGNNRLPTRVRINRMIADFFASHNQSELAAKCLRKLIPQDADALYDLAIQTADSGEAATAALYFDALWERAEIIGRQNTLGRFTEKSAARATKAQIALWILKQRNGDREQADEARELIEWTLCSPSVGFLTEIATELAERGEAELAKDTLNVLLPLTALGVSETTDLYDVGYDYVDLAFKEDPESALHWFELAVNETYQDARSSSFQIVLPMMIQTWKLESAIDAGDSRGCEEALKRVMQLDHLDIRVAEELLPKMREAGMKQLADKYFDQVFEQGQKYVATFPQDARIANNIAWVAAMNHLRLDEALKLSKHSVYFEPDSPVYRDTLAEILFQLDRKKEALLVEESCLLDDPSDWHTHVQVNKYRKAVEAK